LLIFDGYLSKALPEIVVRVLLRDIILKSRRQQGKT